MDEVSENTDTKISPNQSNSSNAVQEAITNHEQKLVTTDPPEEAVSSQGDNNQAHDASPEQQTSQIQAKSHSKGDEVKTADNNEKEKSKSSENDEAKSSDNTDSAGVKPEDDSNDKKEEKEDVVFERQPKLDKADDAMKLCKEYIEYLATLDEFDNAEVLNIVKTISKMYNFFKRSKQKIGQYLIELGLADQVKKMTIYFNRVGIFKNDNVWFPNYYTSNLVWNYTDCGVEFAKAIINAGMVHYYVLNLSHQPYLENRSSKNVSYVLKSSLSTLQNLVRQCPESKPVFDDEKLTEVIYPFLKDEDDFMKCVAILTLSAIISEDEIAKMEDTGYIGFIVKAISTAARSTKKRYRGFTALELIEGLSRIAVSDFNKKKIVDQNALPILVILMNSANTNEQLNSAKTIWTLCFDEYSRQKVKEEPDCLETLERLKLSEDKSVSRAANGALWKINEEEAHRREKTMVEGLESDKHIFLSYNHGHADMVIRIKDKLKADKWKVWIDVEQMGGSTLEAMAEAVENAQVVLVCASDKYKQSPNCRTEAEYTFQLKRPIVPLMMQRRYKADGWLGMLMGAKKYINFDGKFEFDYAYNMLIREINRYVKKDDVTAGMNGVVEQAVVAVHDDSVLYSAPSFPRTPPLHAARTYQCVEWTNERVQEWLKTEFNSVLSSELQTLLGAMDGKLLVAFCKIEKKAADYFYNHLTDKYRADIVQLSHLTHALDQLP